MVLSLGQVNDAVCRYGASFSRGGASFSNPSSHQFEMLSWNDKGKFNKFLSHIGIDEIKEKDSMLLMTGWQRYSSRPYNSINVWSKKMEITWRTF